MLYYSNCGRGHLSTVLVNKPIAPTGPPPPPTLGQSDRGGVPEGKGEMGDKISRVGGGEG